MKQVILISILYLIIADHIHPQANPWIPKNTGLPASPMVRAICQKPNGEFFIGIDGEGVYYSGNGGNSWTTKSSGIGTETVWDIQYDASSGRLIAGTGSYIFYSTNNGDNWIQSFSTGANCIKVVDAGNIFAGLNFGGVAKSTNNGTSWFLVNNGLPVVDVRYLAFDHEDNPAVYATPQGYGLYKTTNYGNSWFPINSGINDTLKIFFTIEVKSDHEIFAGYEDGIYFSGNLGATWTEIYHREARIFKTFAFTKNGQIFRGDANGWVHLSTDNGVNWDSVSSGLTNGYTAKLMITNTGLLYAGTGDGFFVNDSYLYPSAPAELTTDAVGARKINLTWNRSGNNPGQYFIYRSNTQGGTYSLIDSVSVPDTTYTDEGLNPSTAYYYKLIAFNEWGLSPFSNIAGDTTLMAFTDPRDGREYSYVTIGTQTWMAENLNTTKFLNGESIPNVTGDAAWHDLTTGAYCNYNNDSTNSNVYGRFYNWYAVKDSRKLAPQGWRIPSDTDWDTLVQYLGGNSVAGGKLKEKGFIHWSYPNTGATNVSQFTALPAGQRNLHGVFGHVGNGTAWWTSTEYISSHAWYYNTDYNYDSIVHNYVEKTYGISIRCIKSNLADPPSLTSFTPTSGQIGTTVTISGSNFNSTPANNVVYFGAVKAAVTGGNSTQLTVTVPVGATHQPISVTDTTTHLTAYSAKPFTITFNNTKSLNDTAFAAAGSYSTMSSPWGVTLADIDGDGKSDALVPNYGTDQKISILRNTSTTGAVSFAAKTDFTNAGAPTSIKTADFDGDGKLDIAVTKAYDGNIGLEVFRNLSTNGNITLGAKLDLTMVDNINSTLAAGDLNGDGKIDMVAANGMGYTLSVFRNISGSGSISFSSKADITTAQKPVAGPLTDLDGDGKSDLVIVNPDANTISVFRNTSTLDTITFAAPVNFNAGSTPQYATAADLDLDGKVDIVVSDYEGNTLSIFRNISTPGTIGFAARTIYNTGTHPYGLSPDDMDGDGKIDIVVGHQGSDSISVFKNMSTSGTISFAARINYSAPNTPLVAATGDIDGDGKPDIVFNRNTAGTIGVLRNLLGAVPTAPGNLTATAVSPNQINLFWTTSENSPVKYYIHRSTSMGGAYSVIDSVTAPDTIYSNTGLNPSMTFHYKITAKNPLGLSPASNIDSATTFGIPLGSIGWVKVGGNFSAGIIEKLCVDSSNNNIFAGTYGSGILLTTNYGVSWMPVNSGITNNAIWDVTFNPNLPQTLLAGTYGGDGLFISTNYGGSWFVSKSGLTDTRVHAITFNPSVPGQVFTGTWGGGVFKSNDNGASWSASGLSGNQIYTVEISGTAMLAGTWGNGIYRSTDNGSSWYSVRPGLYMCIIKKDPQVAGKLYAGSYYDTGLFISTNYGVTWTESNNGILNKNVISITFQGSNIFIGTFGGVYVSTNGGTNWTKVCNGLAPVDTSVYSMAVSGPYLFAGTYPGKVYRASLTEPTAPTNLSATGISSTRIELTWSGSAGPQYYIISRSSSYGGTYTKMDSVLAPLTAYSDTGLSPQTTFYYKVHAVNALGLSTASNIDSGTTFSPSAPTAPADLTATGVSSNQINLSWTASTGAPAKYRIFRSNTSGSGFTPLDSVSEPTVTYYDHTGLNPHTVYYYRIFAVNNYGMSSSSNEAHDTTLNTFTDPRDGRVYSIVTIGTQTWMAENLMATKYRNGDNIPNVTDTVTWSGLTTGAYCNYDNDANNSNTYGRLYNWHAVNDPRGLAPIGWHVASDDEWYTLVNHLGDSSVAGGKLKEAGYTHWTSPNTGATNETGFTALPGGYRIWDIGNFTDISVEGIWWASSEYDGVGAWLRGMHHDDASAGRGHVAKTYGFSVRCVKDNIPTSPSNLTATAVSSSQIDLIWTASGNNPDRYRIYRSSPSNTSYVYHDSVTSTTYSDTKNTTANTIYYYKVYGINTLGVSPASNEDSSKTFVASIPTAPTNLIATGSSSSQINLSWTASGNSPDRYRIYRSSPSNTSYIYHDSAITNSYSDTKNTTSNTVYYYKVYGVNILGVSPASNEDSAQTFMSPPSFIGTPILNPATLGVGNWVDIKVKVKDNPYTITLYYGNSSQSAVKFKAMGYISIDTVQTNIMNEDLTINGLWYRIKAENAVGIAYYPSQEGWVNIPLNLDASNFVTVLSNSGFPQIFPGKRFFTVALPCSSTVNLVSKWGTQERNSSNIPTNWRAGKFVPGTQQFSDVSILSQYTGYVIYNSKSVHPFTEMTTGKTSPPGLLDTITLVQGWNLIPWPYASTVNVLITNSVVIDPIWFKGENDWQSFSNGQFKPFRAYAIKKKTPGTVLLKDVISITSVVEKSNTTPQSWNWSLKLSASCGDHYDLDNYIGTVENALNEYDPADASEPMDMQDGVSLYFAQSDQKLAFDVRSADDPGHIWDAVMVNHSSQSSATLTWDNSAINNGWLVDMDNNRFINLAEQSSYSFQSQKKHRFKVIAGELNYIEKEVNDLKKTMPETFQLYANYPNPFNPNTTIQFDVAKTGNVKLQIYNILGQLVTTLVNGNLETGKYDIQWNGKDVRGKTVSSGIYIYRLVTDRYVKSRKMILVR